MAAPQLMPSWTEIQPILASYGYPLLLPAAVVEGPIVTVVAGLLAASGVFTWYWVLAIVICGDLLGDILFYCVGRFSGSWLARLARRLGLSADRADSLRERMDHHGSRMLLIGKWTHAIGGLVLIAAGAAKMRLDRFMLVNLALTLPKSALLLAVGYFAFGLVPYFANRPWLGLGLLVPLGLASAALVWRGTVRHSGRSG